LTRFIKQHLPGLLPTFLLALLGLGAAFTAFSYDVGSFTGMGPGFFPLALGLILFLLGGVILWQDRQPPEAIAEQAHPFAWRPFAAVSAGILAWVLLAETTGFFVAAACQVVLTSLALPKPRWRSIAIMAAVLATGGYLLFVTQLGVPLSAVG